MSVSEQVCDRVQVDSNSSFHKEREMKRKGFLSGAAVAAGLAVLSLGVAANAAIVLHSGANDPTTEGWTFDVLDAGNISTGGITNDNGSGFDAWYVNDNSPTGYGLYYKSLSPSDQTTLTGNDWVGSLRLRMTGPNLPESGEVAFNMDLGPGNKRFLVYFGTNASSDTKYQFYDAGGNLFQTNTGLNGTNYHLYEFKYKQATAKMDVYIDGNLYLSDWSGIAGTTQNGPNGNVLFGSGAGGPKGQGNYNLVQVAVPEPASLGLIGGLGIMLLSRRRKA